MSWQHLIVVALMTAGALATIASIGQERKPITPVAGAWTVVYVGVLIYLVVTG